MNKRVVMIIIAVVVVIALVTGVCLIVASGKANFKKEVVTQENYEQILDKIVSKLGETDETYQYTYACIYYTAKAGLTDEYLQEKDEAMLYKEITGKTVQQLIDEGKQLMEENNITVEHYKQQLEELGATLKK